MKIGLLLAALFGIIFLIFFPKKDKNIIITAEDMFNGESVRLLGRYSFEQDTAWFDYTLSGIEFSFTGRKCVVHFSSDFLSDKGKHAIVGVFINDSEEETMRLEISEASLEAIVFESGKDEEAKIKIVKLSEAKQGTVGIKEITGYGKNPSIHRTSEREKLLQFIGDSITCGMGNETVWGEEFTTNKENGNMTYGAITARHFEADVEFVSYSGIGLIWGTDDSIPPMTEMYEYSGYTRGKRKGAEWEKQREPDVICINLGTNDAKYIEDSDMEKCFFNTYINFLKKIRIENPHAYIIVCYGPMNFDLEETIKEAILEYVEQTEDERIEYLAFDKLLEEGSGVGGHPTVATHKNMAYKLIQCLEEER